MTARHNPFRAALALLSGALYSQVTSGEILGVVQDSSGGGIADAAVTSYIDDASEIFNPSTTADVAVSQDSFNRNADRARSLTTARTASP